MPRPAVPRRAVPRRAVPGRAVPGLVPRLAAPGSRGRRLALPGAVLLALALVFLVAWGTRPGPAQDAAPGGQVTAVTSVTRSCPPAAPGTGAARISAIALPSLAAANQGTVSAGTTSQGTAKLDSEKQGAATPTGAATFAPVSSAPAASAKPPAKRDTGKAAAAKTGTAKTGTAKTGTAKAAAGTRAVTVSAPGTVATVTAAGGGGTAVAATGKMAMGFEAEQTNASGTGMVSCTHPGSDMWFVGTGQSEGAQETMLYLMNTGMVTVSADLTILTDTGQQNGLSSAITVLPNQFVAENITPYVQGSQALALHVQATSGQVAASVWQGGTGGGAWLPQAAAASTSLVIPGLTVASSAAKLFVVVPGGTDAQVKIVADTPAGAVAQFPGTPVDATAGAATPVALNSLGASAAGLRLTSSVPIVAGVLVPGTGIGSFTTAESPVTEQGVVAGNPATRGVTVGLLLTAPTAAARVSISVISTDGTVTRPAADQAVKVAAGHSLAVSVPRPPGGKPFAIVVTPAAGSGPVYAVRVVTSGTGGLSAPVSSLLPVPSALASITLPGASNSYSAVLP
jgi:hypothetical protein